MSTNGTIKAVLAAALAGLLAGGMAGCQSATKTNLAEYESLVARRRAPSATPMAVRAAQEKAAEEARREAEARAKAAEARALKAEREAAAARKRAEAQEKAAEARREAEEKRAGEAKAQEARKAAEAKAAEERRLAEARRAEEEARRAREVEEADDDWGEAVEVVAPPTAPAPAPENRGDGGNAYVLAVGDAVQIFLRGIPTAEAIEDIIDEGGYVSLPLINEVKAAGCTATQLEKTIRDTYRERRIYKDLSVQVMVPTRYYYMQGEIRGPGRVQLISAVRLSQAIAANGGGTEFWNGKVVVKRNDGRVVNVKNARRLERTPEEDILLEPGDIVELKRTWF